MTNEAEIRKKLHELNICVIVPTYNNEKTLESLISGLKAYSETIIVVNDGSTDSTASILEGMENMVVCSYPKNSGKGYALQTGFRKALALGFDYAVSIDSDGQHYPSEIAVLLGAHSENPGAIIIGARNLHQENMPGKNTFANRFSNCWFWVETGLKLPDTQSGFRLYPLRLVANRHFFTRHYDFELEALVRSAWNGTPVISVPVKVHYPPDGERISHFKPFKDFTRISILNTFLVLIAFLWVKPFHFVRQINRETAKAFLSKHIFASTQSNRTITLSVMLGIFLGIVPIWGYQMLVAYAVAHFFKLNKAIALVASNISLPPMIPFILFGSYAAGALIFGNSFEFSLASINFKTIKQDIIQYFVGSIVLAAAVSVVFGMITYLLLRIFRKNKKYSIY
ncbi:MAG: DUF2062 domain-containing protein [Dysgonamonadaceae bacterium]|jgi:glycosyltransferase involved in cell wall biosynthesis|nr:DUF2062 domain-containing protein [Dysgonamonadaceae bacterium]